MVARLLFVHILFFFFLFNNLSLSSAQCFTAMSLTSSARNLSDPLSLPIMLPYSEYTLTALGMLPTQIYWKVNLTQLTFTLYNNPAYRVTQVAFNLLGGGTHTCYSVATPCMGQSSGTVICSCNYSQILTGPNDPNSVQTITITTTGCTRSNDYIWFNNQITSLGLPGTSPACLQDPANPFRLIDCSVNNDQKSILINGYYIQTGATFKNLAAVNPCATFTPLFSNTATTSLWSCTLSGQAPGTTISGLQLVAQSFTQGPPNNGITPGGSSNATAILVYAPMPLMYQIIVPNDACLVTAIQPPVSFLPGGALNVSYCNPTTSIIITILGANFTSAGLSMYSAPYPSTQTPSFCTPSFYNSSTVYCTLLSTSVTLVSSGQTYMQTNGGPSNHGNPAYQINWNFATPPFLYSISSPSCINQNILSLINCAHQSVAVLSFTGSNFIPFQLNITDNIANSVCMGNITFVNSTLITCFFSPKTSNFSHIQVVTNGGTSSTYATIFLPPIPSLISVVAVNGDCVSLGPFFLVNCSVSPTSSSILQFNGANFISSNTNVTSSLCLLSSVTFLNSNIIQCQLAVPQQAGAIVNGTVIVSGVASSTSVTISYSQVPVLTGVISYNNTCGSMNGHSLVNCTISPGIDNMIGFFGVYFLPAISVSVGSVCVPGSIVYGSSNSFVCSLASNVAGFTIGSIQVLTNGGASVNSVSIQYAAQPQLTAIVLLDDRASNTYNNGININNNNINSNSTCFQNIISAPLVLYNCSTSSSSVGPVLQFEGTNFISLGLALTNSGNIPICSNGTVLFISSSTIQCSFNNGNPPVTNGQTISEIQVSTNGGTSSSSATVSFASTPILSSLSTDPSVCTNNDNNNPLVLENCLTTTNNSILTFSGQYFLNKQLEIFPSSLCQSNSISFLSSTTIICLLSSGSASQQLSNISLVIGGSSSAGGLGALYRAAAPFLSSVTSPASLCNGTSPLLLTECSVLGSPSLNGSSHLLLTGGNFQTLGLQLIGTACDNSSLALLSPSLISCALTEANSSSILTVAVQTNGGLSQSATVQYAALPMIQSVVGGTLCSNVGPWGLANCQVNSNAAEGNLVQFIGSNFIAIGLQFSHVFCANNNAMTIVNSSFMQCNLISGTNGLAINNIVLTTNGGTAVNPVSISFSPLPILSSIGSPSCLSTSSLALTNCTLGISDNILYFNGTNLVPNGLNISDSLCRPGTITYYNSTTVGCLIQYNFLQGFASTGILSTNGGTATSVASITYFAAVPLISAVATQYNQLCEPYPPLALLNCSINPAATFSGILYLIGNNFITNGFIILNSPCISETAVVLNLTTISCTLSSASPGSNFSAIQISTIGGASPLSQSPLIKYAFQPTLSSVTILNNITCEQEGILSLSQCQIGSNGSLVQFQGMNFISYGLVIPATVCIQNSITLYSSSLITCILVGGSYSLFTVAPIITNGGESNHTMSVAFVISPPTISSISSLYCSTGVSTGNTFSVFNCPNRYSSEYSSSLLFLIGQNFVSFGLSFSSPICLPGSIIVVNTTYLYCTLQETAVVGFNGNATVSGIHVITNGGATNQSFNVGFATRPMVTEIRSSGCEQTAPLELTSCSLGNNANITLYFYGSDFIPNGLNVTSGLCRTSTLIYYNSTTVSCLLQYNSFPGLVANGVLSTNGGNATSVSQITYFAAIPTVASISTQYPLLCQSVSPLALSNCNINPSSTLSAVLYIYGNNFVSNQLGINNSPCVEGTLLLLNLTTIACQLDSQINLNQTTISNISITTLGGTSNSFSIQFAISPFVASILSYNQACDDDNTTQSGSPLALVNCAVLNVPGSNNYTLQLVGGNFMTQEILTVSGGGCAVGSVRVVSNSVIQCLLANGTAGSLIGPIIVRTIGGSSSNLITVQYSYQPVLTSIVASSANCVSSGALNLVDCPTSPTPGTIQFLGMYFLPAISVSIGSICLPGSIVYKNSNNFGCSLASHVAGITIDSIQVITNGGTSVNSSSVQFAFQPQLTAIVLLDDRTSNTYNNGININNNNINSNSTCFQNIISAPLVLYNCSTSSSSVGPVLQFEGTNFISLGLALTNNGNVSICSNPIQYVSGSVAQCNFNNNDQLVSSGQIISGIQLFTNGGSAASFATVSFSSKPLLLSLKTDPATCLTNYNNNPLALGDCVTSTSIANIITIVGEDFINKELQIIPSTLCVPYSLIFFSSNKVSCVLSSGTSGQVLSGIALSIAGVSSTSVGSVTRAVIPFLLSVVSINSSCSNDGAGVSSALLNSPLVVSGCPTGLNKGESSYIGFVGQNFTSVGLAVSNFLCVPLTLMFASPTFLTCQLSPLSSSSSSSHFLNGSVSTGGGTTVNVATVYYEPAPILLAVGSSNGTCAQNSGGGLVLKGCSINPNSTTSFLYFYGLHFTANSLQIVNGPCLPGTATFIDTTAISCILSPNSPGTIASGIFIVSENGQSSQFAIAYYAVPPTLTSLSGTGCAPNPSTPLQLQYCDVGYFAPNIITFLGSGFLSAFLSIFSDATGQAVCITDSINVIGDGEMSCVLKKVGYVVEVDQDSIQQNAMVSSILQIRIETAGGLSSYINLGSIYYALQPKINSISSQNCIMLSRLDLVGCNINSVITISGSNFVNFPPLSTSSTIPPQGILVDICDQSALFQISPDFSIILCALLIADTLASPSTGAIGTNVSVATRGGPNLNSQAPFYIEYAAFPTTSNCIASLQYSTSGCIVNTVRKTTSFTECPINSGNAAALAISNSYSLLTVNTLPGFRIFYGQTNSLYLSPNPCIEAFLQWNIYNPYQATCHLAPNVPGFTINPLIFGNSYGFIALSTAIQYASVPTINSLKSSSCNNGYTLSLYNCSLSVSNQLNVTVTGASFYSSIIQEINVISTNNNNQINLCTDIITINSQQLICIINNPSQVLGLLGSNTTFSSIQIIAAGGFSINNPSIFITSFPPPEDIISSTGLNQEGVRQVPNTPDNTTNVSITNYLVFGLIIGIIAAVLLFGIMGSIYYARREQKKSKINRAILLYAPLANNRNPSTISDANNTTSNTNTNNPQNNSKTVLNTSI